LAVFTILDFKLSVLIGFTCATMFFFVVEFYKLDLIFDGNFIRIGDVRFTTIFLPSRFYCSQYVH